MPSYKIENGKIWDIVRKQWLYAFPEEVLRQQVINYLIHEKKYPLAFIAVEKEFLFQQRKKRFDIVVYNDNFTPHILVECKQKKVPLDHRVSDQILPYLLALAPQYVVITNGERMLVYKRNNETIEQIETIPTFDFIQ